MRLWLRGWRGGVLAYLLIAALVVGGLGWVTRAVLRLENEQWQARVDAQRADKVRMALWQLDGRISTLMAREESRPFHHYSIFFAPTLALRSPDLKPVLPGSVLQVSPLMHGELPDWMLLHFQIDPQDGWTSPQAPTDPTLVPQLQATLTQLRFVNVTAERAKLLQQLSKDLPAKEVLATARVRGGEPILTNGSLGIVSCNVVPWVLENQRENTNFDAQTKNRFALKQKLDNDARQAQQQAPPQIAYRTVPRNSANTKTWIVPQFAPGALKTSQPISLTSLAPVWVSTVDNREQLLVVRRARVGSRYVCQGIVLDEARLKAMLLDEIKETFPNAKLVHAQDEESLDPTRTMATVPFQLDAGPLANAGSPPKWTPLRIGLLLAWVAAGVALLAVALGGWSLMDLSERRFRFVSAVTHELRTPLTTLRLYLDMLTGGMVRDEEQKKAYLQTLHTETDRLNRLVANVLDLSRLERQKPNLEKTKTKAVDLLTGAVETWAPRCSEVSKKLIIESALDDECRLETDAELVQQVLGNLLDNACKYTKESQDASIFLRACCEKDKLVLEVEDRGPGIAKRERRAIFRAFRRGRESDVKAGGVGLGLALAHRWSRLLGGRLSLRCVGKVTGACFRLELPLKKRG